MQQNEFSLLEDRKVLYISQIDRAEFLQGIITNDIKKLQSVEMIYAYILNPQGRIICDAFISNWQDGYILDVDQSTCNDLYKRLNMFKLKSKVSIDLLPDLKILISPYTGLKDPRHNNLGFRSYTQEYPSNTLPADWYLKQRVLHLIPDFCDMEAGRSLALEMNGAIIGAIDFTKGCYVGQEVTARMWYQKKVRRRLALLEFDGVNPDPLRSTLTKVDLELGVSLSHYKTNIMALLNHEEVAINDLVQSENNTYKVLKISDAGLNS